MLKPNFPQNLPPSLLHRNGMSEPSVSFLHLQSVCVAVFLIKETDFYFSQVQGQQNSLGYTAVSQEEKLG